MAGPSKSSWRSFLGNVFKAITGAPVRFDPAQPDTALGRARNFIQRLGRVNRGAGRMAGQIIRGVAQVVGLARADFRDGEPKGVSSSWIKSLTYTPLVYRAEAAEPDEYGGGFIAVPDARPRGLRLRMNDIGDLTMQVITPSHANPSGAYIYPKVPRRIMADWVQAASAGKYYWGGEIRIYSDRRGVFQRLARYGSGIAPRQSAPRPRRR